MSSVSPPLEHAGRRARDWHHRLRTRVAPFPLSPGLRWLVRLGFAAPYVVIALLAARGHAGPPSDNDLVYQHVLGIDWSRADVEWVRDLYPPLGMIFATGVMRLIPLGDFGLALLGAAVAGHLGQKTLESMRQRVFPPTAIALFCIALFVNPFTVYLVERSTLLFICIALFALGTDNMTRFIAFRSTRDGFRAGLFFMLAALTDSVGIILVATAAVSSLFLRPGERQERGRRRADLLVIAFPTIGTLALWYFLQWAFGAVPYRLFGIGVTPGELADELEYFYRYGWIVLTTVACICVVALLARRPSIALMTVALAAVYVLALFIGLGHDPSAAGFAVLVLLLLIFYTPEIRPRAVDLALPSVAGLQVAIMWIAGIDDYYLVAWFNAVRDALGG
ncbi:hypothetical protein GCM10022286_24050 [Gryllotalpicola daejeonensis]|uniref:Glycosyltransferase RgtA/B/C/D-like domain-containing protein n=1 Tax=Gryllotalpicola daejeonensis TaxID=993087 RepID=A0ABP7ZLT6_9MICO